MSQFHAPPLRTDGRIENNAFLRDALAVDAKSVASWLTSMLVHMILLLVLALLVLGTATKQPTTELAIAPLDAEPEVVLDLHDDSIELDPPLVQPSSLPIDELLVPTVVETDRPPLVAALDPQPVDTPSLPINIDGPGFGASPLGCIDDAPAGDPYDRRKRREAMRHSRRGPNVESEKAVEAALAWLAAHQNRNGSWSFDHTAGDRCSGFANPGDKRSRMGATGLALLPFLGAGYTHRDGKYRESVRRGIKYLVGNMEVAGGMGRLFEKNGASHEHMYSHGIASCTLAEAYGMTQDPKLRAPAQLSLNYIVQAQHPANGGWIYTPRAGGDTSVVGWQVMALKSGILSYLKVPGHVKTLTTKWLDTVQSDLPPGGYGIGSRYGYRRPADRDRGSAACSAIGLLCRNYLGTRRDDAGLKLGVRRIAAQGPHADDMYYNYYATMVMFQNDEPGGELWTRWNTAIRNHLVGTQVVQGSDRGSWHYSGNHGDSGGRLYNTALACMTLEVPYRYLPIYGRVIVEEDDFPLE